MTNIFNVSGLKWTNQRGQGLIETLMIAVFVGVNVIAFISFQSYLSYSTELTQQQSNANLITTAEIESLRDFSVLNTTSGVTAYANIVTGSTVTPVGNTSYTTNWTVTPAVSLSYKTVSVTTTWTDRRGVAQSVTLVTIIAGIDPGGIVNYM